MKDIIERLEFSVSWDEVINIEVHPLEAKELLDFINQLIQKNNES